MKMILCVSALVLCLNTTNSYASQDQGNQSPAAPAAPSATMSLDDLIAQADQQLDQKHQLDTAISNVMSAFDGLKGLSEHDALAELKAQIMSTLPAEFKFGDEEFLALDHETQIRTLNAHLDSIKTASTKLHSLIEKRLALKQAAAPQVQAPLKQLKEMVSEQTTVTICRGTTDVISKWKVKKGHYACELIYATTYKVYQDDSREKDKVALVSQRNFQKNGDCPAGPGKCGQIPEEFKSFFKK